MVGASCNSEAESVIFMEASSRIEERICSVYTQEQQGAYPDSYLEHIMEHALEIRRKNQERLLYTNSKGGSMDSRSQPWESVPFKHPSTFDTLALDRARKEEIKDDLEAFAKGKEFYQNTGRA
jgi:hypothetical protein